MIIVYAAWGTNIDYHLQTAFSIVTTLSSPCVERVVLLADDFRHYGFLRGRIDTIQLDTSTLEEWRGQDDYLFRIKIKAVQKAIQAYPAKDIVFLDGDTFCYGGLETLAAGLKDGKLFMHELHCLICTAEDRTTRRFWNFVKGKSFAGIEVNTETPIWNSGVIAMPGKDAARLVDKVLEVNDDMYPRSSSTAKRYNFTEQIAFAMVLSQMPVSASNSFIGHYWGNKPEWLMAIRNFFVESKLSGRSLDDDLVEVKRFDFWSIPVHVRRSKTLGRIERLAGKLYPLTKVRYIPGERVLGERER
jgi:hypothetical protein